jgi:hypothetical protein
VVDGTTGVLAVVPVAPVAGVDTAPAAVDVVGVDTAAVGAWPLEQPASNKLNRSSPVTVNFSFTFTDSLTN